MLKEKVILFIQTFYFFLQIFQILIFDLYTYLRINFEKIWFNMGLKNADEIWVQTITMKKKTFKFFKKKKYFKKNNYKNNAFN